MITLTYTNDSTKKFNLKNFEREKSLSEMLGYLKATGINKKIKITTTDSEIIIISSEFVTDCKFTKSEYIKGEIH